MADKRDKDIAPRSSRKDVDDFIRQLRATPVQQAGTAAGRLIFAMDATASRGPAWDRAAHIQARMFESVSALGGLEIQLCYYRGFREFHSTTWLSDSSELLRRMTQVSCRAGYTQISRVLAHALEAAKSGRVNALVFVGDCVEEPLEELGELAGQLGVRRVPAFMFQEGRDPEATRTFAQIAKLSGGAHCRFDAGSADQLRDLLCAVAVYSSGGLKALRDFSRRSDTIVYQLTRQLDEDLS